MKVYTLSGSCGWDGDELIGIYSSAELAKKAQAKCPAWWDFFKVDEIEVDAEKDWRAEE